MNPPAFRGKKDPTEAEDWLTELRIIFDYLGCTDAERVSMSAYMLKGRARDWWGTTQGILMSRQDVIGWEEFQTAFRTQYVPRATQRKKQAECLSLVQDDMCVDDYES